MLAECLDLSFHLQPGWFWLMFVILGSWWITLPPRLPSATRKFSHTRRGKHQFHQQWCCNLFFWALVIAISGNWGNWGNEPWYWCTSGIDSLIPSFPMSRTSYFLPKYIPPAKWSQNQAMKWAESRATALHGAMAGWGTAEDQLIRVIICASFKDSLSKCVLHLPVASWGCLP